MASLFKPSKETDLIGQSAEWHYKYTTVAGFFLQDGLGTNARAFDAMNENFGLIPQEYDSDKLLPANGNDLTQWQRFAHKVKVMNERAAEGVSYKLLYLGRHGQGYHNVAYTFYGPDAWDCYYSTLKNDPNVPSVTFFDAHLTRQGVYEAGLAFKFWDRLISSQKIPLPQSYYCSPHTRALQTAQITFSQLILPTTTPFKPMIKEFLREEYGLHTCDSRPTRTYLRENFPGFDIEDGFTEADELFSPTLRESHGMHTHRMKKLLDDVIKHDNSTYISMTCHSGTIAAVLSAVQHRPFMLPTGGVIPVLVRAQKVAGARSGDETEPDWQTKPECHDDPKKASLPGYRDIDEYIKYLDGKVPQSATAV